MALLVGLCSMSGPGFAQAVEALLEVRPTEQHPRHSEGDLVEFGGGRLGLIYTQFTGGGGDAAPADLVLRTARAGGRDWSEPRVLVPRGDAQNVMSVSTARANDGDWLLFYLRKGEGKNDCQLFVRRTSDEFKTLGEPVRVTTTDGYHVVNNDRVVRLSSGRLIVPSALHTYSDGGQRTWSSQATCFAFMSDDDGRTWRQQTGPGIRGPATGQSATSQTAGKAATVTLQEPGIVELKDGRLMMWMRTSESTQYQAFSSDGGDHWTVAEPGPLISARLSPASIQRVPWSGDLLAVWNDHASVPGPPTANRTPLSVAFSKDDGRTWSKGRPIESDPAGWYAYTAIAFVDHRAILAYSTQGKARGPIGLKVVALTSEASP